LIGGRFVVLLVTFDGRLFGDGDLRQHHFLTPFPVGAFEKKIVVRVLTLGDGGGGGSRVGCCFWLLPGGRSEIYYLK
jgi:hypothetical protein